MNSTNSSGMTSLPSGLSQTTIDEHMPKLHWSRAQKQEVEFAFGRAVILKGLQFDLLNDENFKKAFAMFPVSFQPASGEYVGDRILPVVYNDIQLRVMKEVVQSMAIVLSSDGWTDRKHQSIHNLMVCNPIPFYYTRHKQKTEKADANRIYQIFSEGCCVFLNEHHF